MSSRRAGARFGLTLVACALLAACAAEPPRPLVRPVQVAPRAEPAPVTLAPVAPAIVRSGPWDDITASFALHDCADSPLIRTAATMYTRSPAHLEQLLGTSLPLMQYVHSRLQAAGMPGEFVMLPLLESSYSPHEPRRRGAAAGMWQLMPATAHMHGVVVNASYDGRLDPVASTRVAIKMLKAFHAEFGDWRLADMAYNAGPNAISKALRQHADIGDAPIPAIRVSGATRKHLARLMALACILREPERFNVKLPRPVAGDELAAIRVPAGTRLSAAAAMAEIREATLRKLNPGYLGTRVPESSPRTLLLPTDAAMSLAAALAIDASESVAQVDPASPDAASGDDIPLPVEPAPPPGAPATASDDAEHHRVRSGETLWSISRHYHVSVRSIERWNDLRGTTLRPGEMLRIPG